MKKAILFLVLIGMMACQKVPITGRSKFNIIPASQIMPMALQAYNETLSKSKTLSKTDMQYLQVSRVGVNIQKAVEEYLTKENHADLIRGYKWEYNVIESDQLNAWCMPGGKIAFYTGILPVCKDDAGVAAVMGHEIAHAIANHSGERMQTQMAVQLGGVGLAVAMQKKPQATQQMAMQAFGIGSNLGVLKFSRKHESEADHMGLMFMAMAGYDPREAPAFWERMKAKSAELGAKKQAEFLSTHPSENRRIADLNKFMPEAVAIYEKVKASKP